MKAGIRQNLPAVLLLAAGVGFMVIGGLRGEIAVVLTKAVNICMECVGIG